MLPPNKGNEQTLLVGGIVPFTTLDYPEHLSAVVFCHGCCWHCPYCHNQEIIDINKPVKYAPSWESVINFLSQRQGLLDAVVFSGGEPLLQPAIKSAIKQVKDMGFKVALHTNGHNPQMLAEVLPDISWIGLDIKTVFSEYYKAVSKDPSFWDKIKSQNFGKAVEKSLDTILKAGTDFECRTTLDPRVVSKDELKRIAKALSEKGVKTYAIQEYRKTDESPDQPSNAAISSFFTDAELLAEIKPLFPHFIIRRA